MSQEGRRVIETPELRQVKKLTAGKNYFVVRKIVKGHYERLFHNKYVNKNTTFLKIIK
jgi:hypothetical protein